MYEKKQTFASSSASEFILSSEHMFSLTLLLNLCSVYLTVSFVGEPPPPTPPPAITRCPWSPCPPHPSNQHFNPGFLARGAHTWTPESLGVALRWSLLWARGQGAEWIFHILPTSSRIILLLELQRVWSNLGNSISALVCCQMFGVCVVDESSTQILPQYL